MKNLALILLLVTSNTIYSQNYHPIVYENTGWNNVGWILDGNMPGSADLYNCFFNGDTLIGNNLYHKHCYDLTHYNFFPLWHVKLDSMVYIGGMRDSGKKYYFIPEGDITETLVYDFNLGINDTVPLGFMPPPAYHKIVLDTTMQTLLDGSVRTQYLCRIEDNLGNFLGYHKYSQTIGNSYSLIHYDLYTVQQYDGGFMQFSYCEDGQLLYLRTGGVSWVTAQNCDFTVKINEFEKFQASNILVEPNPVIGTSFSVKIGFPAEQHQNYKFTIYNSFGQVIHSGEVTIQSYHSELINVNLSSGCYILHLSDSENSYTSKFIKL